MRKIEIPRPFIWITMAILAVGVVVLWRGVAYRADGTLEGSWDLQIVVGDSLANFLGWAYLVITMVLLIRVWTERYVPEAVLLTAGSIAVFHFWSKELPTPPFYWWIIPITAGVVILTDFIRSRRPKAT